MSLVAPLLTAGYGLYLLASFWRGALLFYIHPLYVVPTVVAGLLLLAVVALGMVGGGPAGTRGHGGCDEGHPIGRASPSLASVAVLLLPLAVGFLLPPQPLSILAATQRGVDLPTAGGEDAAPFVVNVDPESFTIKDWVKALQADPEPARHAGKPVRVTGFVSQSDRLPPEWFLVARFVIKCCAVDAQPVGLPVRADGGAVYEAGRWVTVEGRWEVAEIAGRRQAVIAPRRVTPTERPEQPYLY